MLKVFKYPVEVNDIIEIQLPAGAKPLHFEMQHGRLCLWALVDPSQPTTPSRFRMAGTGHPIDTCGPYINTTVVPGGDLVFHFFHA